VFAGPAPQNEPDRSSNVPVACWGGVRDYAQMWLRAALAGLSAGSIRLVAVIAAAALGGTTGGPRCLPLVSSEASRSLLPPPWRVRLGIRISAAMPADERFDEALSGPAAHRLADAETCKSRSAHSRWRCQPSKPLLRPPQQVELAWVLHLYGTETWPAVIAISTKPRVSPSAADPPRPGPLRSQLSLPCNVN